MIAKSKGKAKVERVDLFGDTCKITYDENHKAFIGVGRISPTDVSRLLEKVTEHYAAKASRRGQRISELSSELAELIKADCSFYADTYSYIASGTAIVLESDRKVIIDE